MFYKTSKHIFIRLKKKEFTPKKYNKQTQNPPQDCCEPMSQMITRAMENGRLDNNEHLLVRFRAGQPKPTAAQRRSGAAPPWWRWGRWADQMRRWQWWHPRLHIGEGPTCVVPEETKRSRWCTNNYCNDRDRSTAANKENLWVLDAHSKRFIIADRNHFMAR